MVQRSHRPSLSSSNSTNSSNPRRRTRSTRRRKSGNAGNEAQLNSGRRRRSAQPTASVIPLLSFNQRQSSPEKDKTIIPISSPNSKSKVGQPRRSRSKTAPVQNPTPRSRSKALSTPTAGKTQTSPTGIRRPKRRRSSPMVYGARILILGIGIGVISGTVLSALSSLGRLGSQVNLSSKVLSQGSVTAQPAESTSLRAIPLDLQLRQEDKVLKREITNLAEGLPQLDLGLLLLDLNTGSYVDIKGKSSFASASTIKIPILVAFFQAVDAGAIRLDEMLTMEDQHVAGGSGDLQYQPSGTQYTALEIATKMIVISDNTATNMLITRLGGPEILNKKFSDWGLKDTVLRNILPDLPGTNKTSPRDLANVLSQVNQGGLISMQSRDRMFHIMEQTENNRLIPSGLGAGAIVAHKTGTLNSVLADVGLIDMTNGQRYLLAVLVGRQNDNPDAEYLIRTLSQLVYQHLDTPEPPPEEPEESETEEEASETDGDNLETTDGELTDGETVEWEETEETNSDWETEAEIDADWETEEEIEEEFY